MEEVEMSVAKSSETKVSVKVSNDLKNVVKLFDFASLKLLFVVAIFMILAGLFVPAFADTLAGNEKESCLANLKQIGQAIALYADDYNGYVRCSTQGAWNDANALQWFNWASAFQTLGYVNTEQIFKCPSAIQFTNTGSGTIYYAYGMRNKDSGFFWDISGNTVIGYRAGVPFDTGLAPEKFIIVADTAYNSNYLDISCPWFRTDGYVNGAAIYLRHNGQANCLFADGHVESISGANLKYYKIGSYYDESGTQIFLNPWYKIPEGYDPVVDRTDVVYYDTSYNSFTTSAICAPNGDLIVCAMTQGDVQPPLPGQASVNVFRSSDQGETWGLDWTSSAETELTGLTEQLFNLPDGKILRYSVEVIWPGDPTGLSTLDPAYTALAAGREFKTYYSISEDSGETFGAPITFSDSGDKIFAQGIIVELANGDLLWPWGNCGTSPTISGFKRSTDGGLTWGVLVQAYTDIYPYKNFNEVAVAVCGDGTIVANARVDNYDNNNKRFWQIKSTDNGYNWTMPVQIPQSPPYTIQGGGAAQMYYCAATDQLWLAYRDAGLSPGLALAVSDDKGNSWRYLYHLTELMGRGTNIPPYDGYIYTETDLVQPWRPCEGQVASPCFARLSDTEVYVAFCGSSYPQGATCYIGGNLLRIPNIVTASVSGAGGIVRPLIQRAGRTATIDMTPETHYHIASITDNNIPQTISNPYVINNVNEAHNVVVTFGIDTNTFSASSSGPGSIYIYPTNPTEINYGATAHVFLYPYPNCHVSSITDNGISQPVVQYDYVINNFTEPHDVVVTFTND